MTRRRAVFASIFVVSLLAAVFFFWERVVDGPFPYMTKGVRHFHERESALNALLRRTDEGEEISKLVCYPDSIWVESSQDGPQEQPFGENLDSYLALCKSTGIFSAWRIDDGFLFYYGGETRGGRYFNMALIKRFGATKALPDCSEMVSLPDYGACDFSLSNGWALNYDWTPQNIPLSIDQ